jgi:hypothetical protein
MLLAPLQAEPAPPLSGRRSVPRGRPRLSFRRGSRAPGSRADDRVRGKAITRPRPRRTSARRRNQSSRRDRPAQSPRRSQPFAGRRSRAGTDAAVHRHAVPRPDVTVLDQRLPLRLAKRSLRRRELGRCRCSPISQLSVTAHDVAAFLPMQKSGSATAHPTPAVAMPARASIWSTRPCGMLRLSNSGARLGRGPLLLPCEGAIGGERRSSSSEVQSILSPDA